MSASLSHTDDQQERDEDGFKHWSPASEKYASGDALLSLLNNGWHIEGVVFQQDFWHGGERRVPVYFMKLRNKNDVVKLAVVQNPFVARLFTERNIRVVLMNQPKDSYARA